MNEKIKRLAKIYGKTPDEIIEQLADQALQNGPPAGIGPRLMWLRGVNNMTRDALAEATGISASSIGAYERGEQGREHHSPHSSPALLCGLPSRALR